MWGTAALAPIRVKAVLALVGLAGLMDTAYLLGVIAAYAEHLGASKAAAGFIAGLYSMTALVASVIAGVIVDRIGRRRALAFGLAWDSASLVMYALSQTPAQLAAARVVHAVGGSLVYPAFLAMVGDLARSKPGTSAGAFMAVVGVAVAVGSYAGGRVAASLGFRPALIILALVLLAGFIASLTLPETGKPVKGGLRRVATAIRESRARVLGASSLILALYLGFGVIVGGLATSLTGEGLALDEQQASGIVGMAIGLATLSSLPAFILSGIAIDRGRVLAPVAASSALAIIGALALARSSSYEDVILFAILYGPVIGVGMTMSTYLAITVRGEARGTSVAIQQVSNILGVAIGAPLGGVLSQYMGLEGIALGIGASVFLLAILSAVFSRTLKPVGGLEARGP